MHGQSLTATRELEILEKVATIIQREIDEGYLQENYGCCRQLTWIYYRLGKEKEYKNAYKKLKHICKVENKKIAFTYWLANAMGIRSMKLIKSLIKSH